MWSLLQRHVAELRAAPPGQRFGARYRASRARRRESRFATVMYLSAGVFALLLGIVFSFSPLVPGFVFVLAGLAMLSARLGWLAHRLDRLELACRRRIPPGWLGRRRRRRGQAPAPPAPPVRDAAIAGDGADGASPRGKRHVG